MTDLDHMQRRLSDLESVVRDQGYRIRALEKGGNAKPMRVMKTMLCTACGGSGLQYVPYGETTSLHHTCKRCGGRGNTYEIVADVSHQFCECGRDLCRAPDCPSHKGDK